MKVNQVVKFEIVATESLDGYHILATFQDGTKTYWDALRIKTERGAKAMLTRARTQYLKHTGVWVAA